VSPEAEFEVRVWNLLTAMATNHSRGNAICF
jgi:hypothetical protein